jgi:putative tricarboxylic transport membrane protein
MVNQPQFVYDVVTMTLFATLAILFFGLFMVRPLLKVIMVPRSVIMPIIFVLCTVGSYSIASRLFDVWIMLFVGVCAFVLRKLGYPVAPFVLGLVLGDIVDKSLRRGLVLSDGSLTPFFTRPISAIVFAIVLFTVLMYVPAFNHMARTGWSRIWRRT